jgi:carboxyl-terminal processing protease
MRYRYLLALLAFLLTAAVAGCGVGPNRRISRSTPPAPAAAHSQGASVDNQTGCGTVDSSKPLMTGSHARTISNAYQAIQRTFIRPLDSSSLLNAAWQGALAEAAKEGVSNPGVAAPKLTGSSADANWQAFAASYDTLSKATDGKVDQVQLAFAAVAKMADSVNEGHTYFVDPETYSVEGKEEVLSGGIGVVLNGSKAPFVVEEVVSGGPADHAGVHSGDTVVNVGGCDVSNWDALQLTSHVRGPAGTPVDMVFDRPASGHFEADITRAQVTFPDITSRMLPGNIGYIDLHQFPSPTAVLSGGEPLRQQLTDLLSSFQTQGATGWVLDLRDDPGGEVPAVQSVGGMLLPPGVLFTASDRQGHKIEERTTGSRVATPQLLAVLVNQGSASGSEILSAAIQDYGIAPVVGTKTAGVANAAQLIGIGDGAGISVTTWQTYTPHGRPLNGTGVTPDVQMERTPADLQAGIDPLLQAVEAGVIRPKP